MTRVGAHRYDHHGGAASPGTVLDARRRALQLGDVARFELVERGDAEPTNRASDLAAEDEHRPMPPFRRRVHDGRSSINAGDFEMPIYW